MRHIKLWPMGCRGRRSLHPCSSTMRLLQGWSALVLVGIQPGTREGDGGGEQKTVPSHPGWGGEEGRLGKRAAQSLASTISTLNRSDGPLLSKDRQPWAIWGSETSGLQQRVPRTVFPILQSSMNPRSRRPQTKTSRPYGKVTWWGSPPNPLWKEHFGLRIGAPAGVGQNPPPGLGRGVNRPTQPPYGFGLPIQACPSRKRNSCWGSLLGS